MNYTDIKFSGSRPNTNGGKYNTLANTCLNMCFFVLSTFVVFFCNIFLSDTYLINCSTCKKTNNKIFTTVSST